MRTRKANSNNESVYSVRLSQRCGELMGEFDDYDVYKMVAKNKGKEGKLFDLFCTTESNRKLNSCGGGFAALLDPSKMMDGKGKSYTVKKEAKKDDEDEDEEDEDDHDEL